jgi:hypothetical protein
MRSLLFALFTALLLAASTGSGCRSNRPEQPPQATPAPAATQSPAPSPSDTIVHIDTSAASTPPAQTTGEPASPGAGHIAPAWNRAELVNGVQEFVTAIDSNNEERFWSSLSSRSLKWIDQGKLASRDEVWKAARQTLADIENRRITVIGGSRDSVALEIEGMRMIDGSRENDPIIIHLLREKGAWRVMYPGLLYPMHHLQR